VPTPELGIEKVWLQISLFRGSLLLIPFGALPVPVYDRRYRTLYSVFVFLNRAVMGRFVVPAGALPVRFRKGDTIFSGYCRPPWLRQCRSKPAAQLLPTALLLKAPSIRAQQVASTRTGNSGGLASPLDSPRDSASCLKMSNAFWKLG
jgi:hypothetical protein